MMKLNLNAHHEQLDRILRDHPEIADGSGVYLHLRAVRGAKKSDGTWEHEYKVELVNPFDQTEEG